MITLHEVLVVSLIGNVISQAIYARYYIELTRKSIILSQRTKELEKKNGHEQHQIDQLKAEVEKLKAKS